MPDRCVAHDEFVRAIGSMEGAMEENSRIAEEAFRSIHSRLDRIDKGIDILMNEYRREQGAWRLKKKILSVIGGLAALAGTLYYTSKLIGIIK